MNWDKVNPAFGTAEELKSLVDQAHAKDMYVMLDVVANHCGEAANEDYSLYAPFDSEMWYHPQCDITDYDDMEGW